MRLVAAVPKITQLRLNGTQVGDLGFEVLKDANHLTSLAAKDTGLSEAGHNALLTAKPGLELTWDGPDVERVVAEQVFSKSGMVALKTRGGKYWTSVGTSPGLPRDRFVITAIDFSGRKQVTDEDLGALASLSELKSLKLGGTSITENSLRRLEALKSLESLELGTLRISKQTRDRLASALILQVPQEARTAC